jgi:K(+)-stimulated pyrophosphate-energized sodium pump
VTDNAQSVFELSTIESIPGIKQELKQRLRFRRELRARQASARGERRRRQHVQGDGEARAHRHRGGRLDDDDLFDHRGADARLQPELLQYLSILHPPFLLGLITGGCMIYWFTGASMQAVTTGAYRAVEFIRANIRLDGVVEKASVADSKKVVEICTQYAQRGMFNIFLAIFFATLGFAFLEPYYFIGYLVSIALFGLFQAIFMANAGGAWDNAKKVVEVELKEKGTPLHAATVVGDTVGDPFKDTSSVAMNPVIKFTTLFGLLAVELGVQLAEQYGSMIVTCWLGCSSLVPRSSCGGRFMGCEFRPRPHAGNWDILQYFWRAISRVLVSNSSEDASLTLVFGSDYNSRSCAAFEGARRTSRAA